MRLIAIAPVLLIACAKPAHIPSSFEISKLPVVRIEAPPPPEKVEKPAPEKLWTCAAYCITKYSCSTKGNSSTTSKVLRSEGKTAADAFLSLADRCEGAHASLVVHADCNDGDIVRVGASVATSCAPNN